MPSTPTASIVILTYNNLAYTRQCLESIHTKPAGVDFETIIVDNASQDGTPAYLKKFAEEHGDVKLILNDLNTGFARGNNMGAAVAKGDYLCFLNNDTVVTQGWLAGLIRHLQDPTVGMVGPVTNNSGNETRIQVDYDDLEGMEDFALEYTQAHVGEAFEIRVLPFLCVLLRRSVYESIGPLDERFGQGMFEDDDYALRLREAGYRLLCAEDVFIHHWGSASFSQLQLSEYWYLFDKNRKAFEEKWQIEWQPHLYRSELVPLQIRELVDSTSYHVSIITEQRGRLRQLQSRLEEKDRELDEIYESKPWQIFRYFWSLRASLLKTGRDIKHSLFGESGWIHSLYLNIRKIFRPIKSRQMTWYAYAFDNYKRARHSFAQKSIASVRCPSQIGLVSIILPVYNGADYLREALDSILAQTYQNFELIIVDDGSTDDTPAILQEYAEKDARVRVLSQENQRLPRALSNGFRLSRGEFLTWTSADNRLKPEFLQTLVDDLRRHPHVDMVYANQDIIGEGGEPLRESGWFQHYQSPPGSEHVHLPSDPSELNVWANNYIGGAFMYRDRVHYLIGDYSPWRFGTEDYDYWMRINGLLILNHIDFDQSIYEYRFHSNSLTDRDEELGITRNRIRLMTFEDFRRDFYLVPIAWQIEASGGTKSEETAQEIRKWITGAGHFLLEEDLSSPEDSHHLWYPAVHVNIVEDVSQIEAPPDGTSNNTWNVLISTSGDSLPGDIHPFWKACITTAKADQPTRLCGSRQGWISIPEVQKICTTIDVQARSYHSARLEAEIENPSPPELTISVVICTYHRGELLRKSIQSVAQQEFPHDDYEIMVVNNDPSDQSVGEMITELRQNEFKDRSDRLRLILCPWKGLSFARNVGISEARGEIVCFLDDDALAQEDWLKQVWRVFDTYPRAGVVGGKILLKSPQPRPRWLKPQWEKFWSHFDPDYSETIQVDDWWEFPWGANWSARRKALLEIGGFRSNYGRKGSDFSGGEELVAALLIQQLGYKILIAPSAKVIHAPEVERFNFLHVWKTILAGKYNEYRLQKDLYIPMNLSFKSMARNAARNLAISITKKGLFPHQRWEYLVYTYVDLRLMAKLFKDHIARFRRPFILR